MLRSYQVNHHERHLYYVLRQMYHYGINIINTVNTMMMNKQTLPNFQEYLANIHRGSKQWKDLSLINFPRTNARAHTT